VHEYHTNVIGFSQKNGTAPGMLRAITGIHNVRDVGQILSFAGKSELKHWKTDECNQIRGTDGSVFFPGVTKNDTLHIFNKDLCRSLPLVFQEEVVTNGDIPGYRLALASDFKLWVSTSLPQVRSPVPRVRDPPGVPVQRLLLSQPRGRLWDPLRALQLVHLPVRCSHHAFLAPLFPG
jgi:hypothetical protein